MRFNALKLVQMCAFLPFFSLSQVNVQDQFQQTANWSAFSHVAKVLVFQGRAVSDKNGAKNWGVALSQTFNGGYTPGMDNVTAISANEKVKVLAIGALPNISNTIRGVVRSFFKRDNNYGVLLDYGSVISKNVNFVENKDKVPSVAVFPADDKAGVFNNQIMVFSGTADDAGLRAQVEEAVKKAAAGNGW